MNPTTMSQKFKPKYIQEMIETSDKFIPVVVVLESHLTSFINDAEIYIKEYNVFRADRNERKGGGTAIYVHQSIIIDNVQTYSDTVCEAVMLYSKHRNVALVGVYRPPSGQETKDIHTSFKNLLARIDKFLLELKNVQILMMGDFNLPSINWKTETVAGGKQDKKCAETFLSFMDKHLLIQHVQETTRKDKNTLDLIISNVPENIHSVNVEKVTPKLTDHDLVKCCMTEIFSKDETPENQYSPSHPFDQMNFNKSNWEEIRENLVHVDWSTMDSLNVDEMCNEFEKTLITICEKSTPKHKTGNKSKNDIPSDRRRLIKLKSNLNHKINYSKYIRPDKKKEEKLTTKKKEVEVKIKQSIEEEAYRKEVKMLAQIRTNPKVLYSYSKRKNKTKSKIGPLEGKDGKLNEDPVKIANILQEQYKSAFSDPDTNPIPNKVKSDPTKSPTENGEGFRSDRSCMNQLIDKTKELNISDIDFSEEDIIKAINLIPNNSAGGPDKFPACILKECKQQIANPLFRIWRKSLDTGYIPHVYLQQTIIPIHKKDSKAKAENYRPVSLTSHLIKIFERIMRTRIVDFIEKNNLIAPEQYGFRSGRSCMSQLLSHYEKLIQILEESSNADVLYLDMSKAFDRVDHKILLQKLNALGITGKIHEWLTAFLTNREQTVMVDGHKSIPEKVLSGVPQGTVLGPVLFILYINDITKVIRNTYIMIFADDSKIIKAINTMQDRDLFNEDLIAVTEWATANKMKLNKLKYQLLQYGKDDELKLPYQADNVQIEKSETVKDIGVLMSDNLLFNDHITEIKNKSKRVAAWIFRLVQSRSAEVVMLLYKTYVRPHLEYSCSLWSPSEIQHISALESIQRSVTARIDGLDQLTYFDRLKKLDLFSLQRRRERYDIIHLWKIQQGIITNDLGLIFYETSRQGWKCRRNIIQSRHRKLSTIRHNSFPHRAAALFNTIPKSVKNTDSLNVFKTRLDKYLKKVPDFPPVHGYVTRNHNSLLDWASCSWEGKAATTLEDTDRCDATETTTATGEGLAVACP